MHKSKVDIIKEFAQLDVHPFINEYWFKSKEVSVHEAESLVNPPEPDL